MKRTINRASLIGSLVIAALGLSALIFAARYGFTDAKGRIGAGFLPMVAGAVVALAAIAAAFSDWWKSGQVEDIIDPDQLLAQIEQQEQPPLAAPSEFATTTEHAPAAPKPQAVAPADEVDIFGRTSRQRKMAVWYVFAAILAALLLVAVIGLLLSMVTLVVFLILVIERRGIVPAVIGGIATFAIAYLVFVLLLETPMPRGMLGLI